MPRQPRPRYTCACLHPLDCCCDACTAEFAEHMAAVRELDELAARDPEPQARAEFAAWASQAEDVTCLESCP